MAPTGSGTEEAHSATQPSETLNMSTIASRLGVARPTVRERYRELRGCALKRVQSFPWGETVGDSSLNDYLSMLIDTEEKLSQRAPRRHADRPGPSTTVSGSSHAALSATPSAPGGVNFRGECTASGNLPTGHVSSSAKSSMLPPAFLANKLRRDDRTRRVKAAQSRLSGTLSLAAHEPKSNPGQSIDRNQNSENTSTQHGSRAGAESGTGKRRRIHSQPSVADTLADARATTISESADGATASLSMLDDEDLAIERQLLAGISPADIIAGSTDGRHASQHELVRSNETQQQARSVIDESAHEAQMETTQMMMMTTT